MLYDNAQLVTLYAEAHRRSPNPLYETVIRESLAFIERELEVTRTVEVTQPSMPIRKARKDDSTPGSRRNFAR